MARLEEDINPEILGWARERAGLSLEKAAKKIDLSLSTLTKMERGERKPTRNQLNKIAKSYWYPLAVFYASQPPLPTKGGVDFRSPNIEIPDEDKGKLRALVRSVYARQEMVKSILEEDKDIEECSFVGSASHDSSVFDAVEIIKLKLKILDGKSLDFKELRDKVEDIGVFVLSINQIRSHHTRIGTKIFRGFAIADNIAPFIIINPDDAKGAQSFTLIHELTHIFIGSSGISAQPNINFLQTPSGKIEKFCNDVASNFLLPTSLIETTEPITDCQEGLGFGAPIANKRKISHLYGGYGFEAVKEEKLQCLCYFVAERALKSKGGSSRIFKLV